MEQKGLRAGHFLGLLGALAALASLWRPWYTVEMPPQLREMLSSEGARSSGALGQFVQGLAAALPSSITLNGWDSLESADVAVCLGAVAVAALVLGAAGAFGSAIRVDPPAAARGIALLGAAGTVLAVVHLLHRPLSAEYVHPAGGLWLALAGCVVATIGGVMAMAPQGVRGSPARPPAATSFPRLEPELPEVFAPAAAAGSVPPPRA
jgi:hypothetical protein